jgi:hypothetical protein
VNFNNTYILELGAGCCGVPGQVAASLGSHVILTDVAEEIISLLDNVKNNMGVHFVNRVDVKELNWNDFLHNSDIQNYFFQFNFDYIICADLLYEHTYIFVAKVILIFLKHNPSSQVLMTNANRKHVHLFRRKLSSMLIFEDLILKDIDFNYNNGQVAWLLKSKTGSDMKFISDFLKLKF